MTNPELQNVVNFLTEIGLPILKEASVKGSFMESIETREGIIYHDDNANPGNLLHEAGHVACAPSELRCKLTGDFTAIGFNELENNFDDSRYSYWSDEQAAGWAYFAALACNVNTQLPFLTGYEGQGLDIWQRIDLSIGTALGCYETVQLYYSGMTNSKKAKSLARWLQV